MRNLTAPPEHELQPSRRCRRLVIGYPYALGIALSVLLVAGRCSAAVTGQKVEPILVTPDSGKFPGGSIRTVPPDRAVWVLKAGFPRIVGPTDRAQYAPINWKLTGGSPSISSGRGVLGYENGEHGHGKWEQYEVTLSPTRLT